MENQTKIGRRAEIFKKNFFKVYLNNFPTLFHICYDPIGTHKKSRAFVGFLFGLSLAIILYEFVIVDLHFDKYTSFALCIIICVMLSVGCASSIQIRCVCALTIPAFFGRSGRSVLRALVFGYVIAGPLFNMVYNAKEVVRTFACTSQLTYNLTKTRFDLMFKPFQQALLAMKTDGEEIKDALSSVKDLVSPIVEEVEGEEEMRRLKEENDYMDELQGDTKRSKEIEEKNEKRIEEAQSEGDVYEAKYKEKIEARCEEQLSRGSDRCRDMFSTAYDSCYEKVTVFVGWLLCWPMKLTFVCNLVQALGGSSICDPEGKVDSGIGQGYAALKSARNEFSRSLKDAKIQYKIKKPPVILDLQDSAYAAKAVVHEFTTRAKLFESVMVALKRCLSFVFLKIILGAQTYHDKYLNEIEHDNVYVTPYFRRIDARRKARGSSTLLPLKKIERKKFIDPYNWKPSNAESFNLTSQMVKLLLEIVTASIFVILDSLFYEVLDIIRRHARIEYTQAGHHDLSLEIRGTGVIATLIRSAVRGFNVKKHIKTVTSNSACLPRPTKLNGYIFFKIYGTFFLIFLLIIGSIYTERMRRGICSFFYRKREKRRTLYLYNESLRRRIGFARFMKARVKRLVRKRHLEYEVDFWMTMRQKWPTQLGWLRFFACARERCLICGEVEPRKGPKYRQCTTPGCPFVHCAECWKDVGKICYACAEWSETDSEEYDTQYTEF
ncbi:PREDICTED: DC-STAMP domain-containing protein 1-like [Dufourea novaeangliae]|uniref:DC-STAMP domain-containing protein 1 n=1 Tax=Dufourea novaeangliae TaxID=178035 RepID=A0A154P4B4_DUFNO|nr:PREDICTED: DC-STAMP domain-containing protein 1-like [Dufourea novaeangliae]KZC06683.1 DC-STAMP domain-containing protein 1 [Dufourea novaeangliae]